MRDKTVKGNMESTEDKKPEEIIPLTLESIFCSFNLDNLFYFDLFCRRNHVCFAVMYFEFSIFCSII